MDIEDQYDRIFRYCYYRVRNREIAEDITQETFLRFLDSAYREQGKKLRYLYVIARNLCIEETRKRGWVELTEEVCDGGEEADRIEDRIVIRQALCQLPEEDRALLVMRCMNGEPIGEISRVTGMSRFAIYRRLKRAKKEFMRLMEGGGQDDQVDEKNAEGSVGKPRSG